MPELKPFLKWLECGERCSVFRRHDCDLREFAFLKLHPFARILFPVLLAPAEANQGADVHLEVQTVPILYMGATLRAAGRS